MTNPDRLPVSPALAASSLTLLSLALLSLTTGCHVSGGNGKGNVEIGTPFGSMHVKTEGAATLEGLGITPYPGATPAHDHEKDHDNDAADINMSFGSFHLGVRAGTYLSSDSQAQILSFYRHDLARYGTAIECKGNQPVGEPARTAQGLTCDDNGKDHGHSGSGVELRVGSPQHQHIVSLESRGDGTRIGLVALDLPKQVQGRSGEKE